MENTNMEAVEKIHRIKTEIEGLMNKLADVIADFDVEGKATHPTEREAVGREILRELIDAGGCDGTDEYDKGWDMAIETAIEIVERVTGVDADDGTQEEAKDVQPG